MKRLLISVLLLLVYGVMYAQDAPSVTTNAVTNISQTSATGGGTITSNGGAAVTKKGICWSTEQNPDTTASHLQATGSGNTFSCNMTNLTPGTTYYVRAYAVNSVGIAYGSQVNFTTNQNAGLPSVTTNPVTNVSQTSATGGGTITSNGGATVTEKGICWSTSHDPTVSGSHIQATGSGNTFACNMTNLTPGTTYYVRAYAVNSAGTAYGNEVSFTTSQNAVAPSVTTNPVTNISQTSATGGGTITSNGGAAVTKKGICWSTEQNPDTTASHLQATGSGNTFSCNMTNLTPGTTYYVRAYAVNSVGIAYGSQVNFTTSQNANLPSVTTNSVTNISQTSATGGGTIISNGGATVTEKGICWSTTHNPTVSGSHIQSSGSGNTFSCNMTNLTPGTTYYVRAYAVNSAGTSYGNEISFTTLFNQPTVNIVEITSITQNSVSVTANVSGNNVTECGVCWSTSPNPNTSGNHIAASSVGTGNFTVTITNLTAGTTYYVRAYAINSAGTAYSNEQSFTTQDNPPAISNVQISNVTQTSATATANVISGVGVTERGVCWSTSHNPNTSGSHTSSGLGLGTFSVNITNLSPGTTYYVRAYAINAVGTAYSSEATFTTQNIVVPTVVTSQISNITTTSATGGGNVTDDGGSPVTERGICWGLSANPTISGSHQSNGTGTGAFTVQMSNLTPEKTYHVRAYAKNSVGTAYGEDVSFITSALPLYEITVIADPEDGGTVEGGNTYQQGQTCTVKATESPSYTFVNWTKNGQEVSENHSYSFTVTEAATYIAHFNAITYTVNVEANPATGGNVSTNGGTYTYGQSCTVKATPKSGYEFENWTENNEIVSTEAEYTFEVVRNYNLVANFSLCNYIITAIANPEEGGRIEGAGVFAYNTNATLHAIANEGYDFENWKENNTVVWAEEVYTFPVTTDRNLEAYFKKKEFTIMVFADPTEGGTVAGGGVYHWKDVVILEAIAKEGYQFTKWQDGNTDNPRVEEVTEDATFTAKFKQPSFYTITATAGPNGSIDPQGEVQVAKGSDVTFTIKPDFGFRIMDIMVDNNSIGWTDSYTFTNVNSDHTLSVSFNGWDVEESTTEINVYPNPAKEMVFVEGDGLATVSLYDLLGNRLIHMDYEASHEMNLSGIARGIYVLMIKTKDGHIGYQKLIVTK